MGRKREAQIMSLDLLLKKKVRNFSYPSERPPPAVFDEKPCVSVSPLSSPKSSVGIDDLSFRPDFKSFNLVILKNLK